MTSKEQKREYNRRWFLNDPEKARALKRQAYHRAQEKMREQGETRSRKSHLSRRYGITEEQFIEMRDAQGGVCAICARECGTYPNLSVDHCHDSGRVRGLLCSRCNLGIGYFQDNPELLSAAANYLAAN